MNMLLGLLLLFASLAFPQRAHADFAYVANNGDDTISVIDLATNTVAATLPGGVGPFGVAITPDGNFAFVTNQGSDDVTVIETTNNTIVGGPIPVGNGPERIGFTPNGAFAYIANFNSNFVSVINTSTLAVTSVPMGVAGCRGIGVTPNGDSVYVTRPVGNSVYVISTATNAVSGPFPAGTAPQYVQVANTANGVYAYVASQGSDTVTVLDTSNNGIVASIPIGAGTDPSSLAIGNTGNGLFVYVANFTSNTVSVINTATNSTVTTIPIGAMTSPSAVAFSPDGNFVYVANSQSNDVAVIDTQTNTLIAGAGFPIPVGNFPFGIAIPQGLGPVSGLSGVQIKNRFLTQVDLVNVITWQADADSIVIGFRIYRNEALTDLAGSVGPNDRRFEDHGRNKNKIYAYFVVAFDAQGNESLAESIVVNP